MKSIKLTENLIELLLNNKICKKLYFIEYQFFLIFD